MVYDPTFKFTGMTVPDVNLNTFRKPLGRAMPRGMSDRRYFQENATRTPFDPRVDQFFDDQYLERYLPEPIVPQARPRRVPTGMADRKAVSPVQQAGRRVPTGMADRKALAGTGQDVGVKQDGGFLSQLYADPSSARGKALQAAAATALQLSGYQDRPVTTGQVLGAMMQSGTQAYDAAQAADLNKKLVMAKIRAEKGSGNMFEGTSEFAQTGNVLLKLAPKVKEGTATPEEQALYSYTYARTQRPRKVISFDGDGNQTITEVPAQQLSEEMFPVPSGFIKGESTTKPSAKALKDSAKVKESRKMLANLNSYRQTITNPEFTVSEQIGGALGFPMGEAATAQAQAEALRLDLKNLYELGALVGGDFQILDNLLTSPNSMAAIKGGREFLLSQLDQLERQLELDMAQKDVTLSGTVSSPIVAKTKEDYASAPNYTYIQLPNGKVVFKDPRAAAKVK